MTARRALTRRRDPRETVDPDAETTLRSALAEAATLDQVLDVLLPYADDPAMRSTATSAGYAKLREIRTADPRSRDKALARLRRLDVATGWAYIDAGGRRRPVRHDAAQSFERQLLRRMVLAGGRSVTEPDPSRLDGRQREDQCPSVGPGADPGVHS